MKNLELAGGHFSDAMDAVTRDDKQRLIESLFMVGYYTDSLDRSDIDVDLPNANAYPIVTWLGFEIEHGTEAYDIAVDIDAMRRHP